MSRALERALAFLDAGESTRAETELRALLRARPGHARALHLFGVAALQRGDAREALTRLERAAAIAPDQAAVHQSLAEAWFHTQEFARAARAAERAIALAPAMAEPWNMLGLVQLEHREYAAAIACFRRAMELRQPYAEAMLNLSVACNRTGEHALAAQLSELVLTFAPGHPGALINLGMAYKGLRQLSQARAAFASAGDHPMARFNLGHTLLLEDDLARGLPLYEARLELAPDDPALGARWDGSHVPHATLLIEHEQGLGDALLMSRFLKPLCDRFARVIVHAPAPLLRLLASLDPRLHVCASRSEVQWDFWCPILSLPLMLGIASLEQLPTRPWIASPKPARVGTLPRVGLNWAGNPAYAYDYVRSTNLATFAPLLAIPDVEWVSLHRGVREHEAEAVELAQPLREARDFLDTANVLAGLDLVISTETAIPNLSAAMGIPTVVLSARDVDWRWRGWYEGVTVAAQAASGDWSEPLAIATEAVLRLRSHRAAA